jgi:hypothetical protein
VRAGGQVIDVDTVRQALAAGGTRLVALRCAGFNHVDVVAAARLGIAVARVPAYSPHAVAEHAVALMLALNRKLHRAYNRVREQDFSLDGLVGFDMNGKTAGIVGTGQIGEVACRILLGFGCTVLAHDPAPNPRCTAMGVRYVQLPELLRASDIVSLHCPLTPGTRHLIGREALDAMPALYATNDGRIALRDLVNAASRCVAWGGVRHLRRALRARAQRDARTNRCQVTVEEASGIAETPSVNALQPLQPWGSSSTYPERQRGARGGPRVSGPRRTRTKGSP